MKFLWAYIILSTSFLGCYEAVNARIEIDVPPDVKKIHIAVCEGTVSEETLLVKETFTPTSTVSIDVPAGDNRIFWVITEDEQGYINRTGVSGLESYESGDLAKLDLEITPLQLTLTNAGVQPPFYNYTRVYWTLASIPAPGSKWKEYYQLKRFDGSAAPIDRGIVYDGEEMEFHDSNGANNYKLRVKSNIFDLYSEWIP
jgi:hypothetical protein